MSAVSCAQAPNKSLYALAEKNSIPLNMMLELTYRCNEACLHCYLPETQGVTPARKHDELSAAEWGRVLQEMADAGTFYLILSGGEVLLKDDFAGILRRARELAFSVEIFSNATLVTPQVADFWAEMGVTLVGVSIYSPEAVWHDRVTKLKGSFADTIRGVALLKERGVAVKLKTPLMKLNWRHYKSLIALAGELGVGYQFDPMMVPRNDGGLNPIRLGLSDEELNAAYADGDLVPADDVLLASPLPLDEPTCSAGRTSGAIGPYGTVYPCIQWMVPAGNVRERAFGDIWRQAPIMGQARSFTGKDIKPCPDCGERHVIHCLGLSQMEKGDALIPDSGSCRLTKTFKEIQEAGK